MSESVASQIVAAAPTSSPEAGGETQAPSAPEAKAPEHGEYASKFAALSKREKRIQEQLNELKLSKSEVEKFNSLKLKVKENPLSVLDEYGITIEQLLTHSLGEDAPPLSESDRLDLMKKEIQALRDEQAERLEAEKKAKETEDQSRIEEAILAHRFKIEEHVSKNSEKYELLHLNGDAGLDLVWEVTEQYFEQNQKVLSPDEAADKVEAYLEQEARKLLAVKKLSPKTDSLSRVNELMERQINPQAPKTSYTLSQDLQTTPQAREYHSVDVEESKARAAAMLKWV